MAEKSAKKKPKKAAKAEPSVLGTLRATRPTRLGGDRRGSATAPRRAAVTTPAATWSPATKAEAPATPKATAAAKPKKAAAPATPEATAAAKPKKAAAPAPKPRPQAAPPAGWQVPGEGDGRGRDGGPTELVTTAVQAAGELAQMGLTVGGQLLKRAAGRLPGR